MTDVAFDKNGKVSATRFRFSHTPVIYQDDFIQDLVLTRRVADLFSDQLIQSPKSVQSTFKAPRNLNMKSPIMQGSAPSTLLGTQETEAPTAFTYSLFYVFYDQYTYIRGVLA